MLKNGRTYFKNLAVFKDQTYLPIAKQTLRCSHWAIFKIWAFFKIMNERVKSVSFIIYLFHNGGRYHIQTSPLICGANQWTGFYMITASVMKELIQSMAHIQA